MKLAIYQINRWRDTDRVAFANLERTRKYQQSEEINSRIYDKVYSGDVDCQSLEDVFYIFNMQHPAGYKGHSLSVSDIVELEEGPDIGFWFCDSFGWKKIDFDPTAVGVVV